MQLKPRTVAALAALNLLAGCGGTRAQVVATPTTTAPPAATVVPGAPTPAAYKVIFDPALCTAQAGAPYGQTVGIAGTNMMVTSADVLASAAGCKVLARGGTAIDAAIAVQAVLGVDEPFASGLFGGSVITYYDAATRKVRAFDGLSAAPANTGGQPDVYRAVAQDVSAAAPYNACKSGLTVGTSLSSQQGNTNISARAVGVPGTLAVLNLVHDAYGKTAWNQLWDDAIALANNGFPMTKYMYSTLYADAAGFDDDGKPVRAASGVAAWVNSAGTAKGAARCKYPDIGARYCDAGDATRQRPLAVGTLIRNPELASTLALVRDGGAAAFYSPAGPVAQAVIAKLTTGQLPCASTLPVAGTAAAPTQATTIASIPSLMTVADFGTYKAVEREPMADTRFGLTIHTQPAPSFGGMVQLYTLGLLERKNIAATAFNGVDYLHLVTEASRLANADRRNIVGDPAYSNIKERVAALMAPSYLDARAALIGSATIRTVPVGTTANGIPAFVANANPAGYDTLAKGRLAGAFAGGKPAHEEDWNTTSNVAIIDGFGNALSMTTTINIHWGAHIEAAGMIINNAMSNFSAGTPGLDVNGYAPFKRPRSSISPSIAFDASGKLKLVWGAAGGGPIPDYIVKTFLGYQVYGMDIQAAINAPNSTGQNGVAELEAGSGVASRLAPLISAYGAGAGAAATGLLSGLSGISVAYDVNGFPVYRGAADYRRNGGAYGY
jgi:gamma-glutamyltranspeptidase/glutathione hydrolase